MIALMVDITSTRPPASRVLSEVAALHLRAPARARKRRREKWWRKSGLHGLPRRDALTLERAGTMIPREYRTP